jgi:mono/diheme cytochrome c family protein
MVVKRFLIGGTVVLVLASLVPPLLIARARLVKSELPRIHVDYGMAKQPKFKAQSPNPLFADGRAMRPPVAGAVAQGDPRHDEVLFSGLSNGRWTTTFPVPVTPTLMRRGQERFDIFCSTCHGLAGAGDGMISKRADQLQEGTWVPPASYHTELIRKREVGHLFNTITHGIRNMPSYGSQVPPEDRWAIVAYVRALQRSQDARIDDVPADIRPTLK